MKLLNMFKKKSAFKNQSEALSLPFKYITRFEDRDEADMRTDLMIAPTNLAVFKVLPYQKQANMYLDCTVYYNNDLSEIYYQIRRIRDDDVIFETDYYAISKETFEDLSKRVGRKINVQ